MNRDSMRMARRAGLTGWSLLLCVAACGDVVPERAGPDDPSVPGATRAIVVDTIRNEKPLDGGDTVRIDSGSTSFVPDRATGIFLNRVGRTIPLVDGGLLVENVGSSQVLVFDADGDLQRVLGGEGDGPTELRRVRATFVCDSPSHSIFIFHGARLSIFETDGTLIRSEQLPEALVQGGQTLHAMRSACSEVVATVGDNSLYEPVSDRTSAHEIELVRISLRNGTRTSLGFFAGIESIADADGRAGSVFPFAYDASWGVRGDQVLYGWGDEPSLDLLSLADGALQQVVTWEATPHPISQDDWASYAKDREARIGGNPRTEALYLTRSLHPRPDRKPLFTPAGSGRPSILTTPDGGFWVRRFHRKVAVPSSRRAPAAHWWVFDADGRWRTVAETPAGLDVRWVSREFIVGVWRDEFGVEEVRKYPIVGAR